MKIIAKILVSQIAVSRPKNTGKRIMVKSRQICEAEKFEYIIIILQEVA
jgi:hypothetical protein